MKGRIRSLVGRLRGAGKARRQRIEREIDDELGFHIEMRTRENLAAGMSPEEARRKARERLGRIAEVRRAGSSIRHHRARRSGIRPLLDDLAQDLRFAARSMAAAPGVTAIFSVVDGVLLEEFPYAAPHRLVQFNSTMIAESDHAVWRDGLSTLQDVSFLGLESHEMSGAGGARLVSSLPVDTRFFSVLGVEAASGRTFVADDMRPDAPLTVVITDRLWRQTFDADGGAVGRPLVLDGAPATVIGVMPPGFSFLRYPDADLFLPVWSAERPVRMAIGRLRDGVTLEQARAEAAALGASLAGDGPEGRARVNYYSLEEVVIGDDRPGIISLAGAVVLVLLIACANVANLLLARALAREGEISVRVALGAGRGRLVRQLLTEGTLLSGIGGLAGVAVAALTLPALLSLSPRYFARLDNIAVDLRVVGFAVGVSLLTGILFGLAPAAFARRTDLRATMAGAAGGASGSRAFGRTLKALVVAEVALSLVLLVGTGLLVRAFLELRPTDPGFDPTGKLMFELQPAERRYPDAESLRVFYDGVLDELRAVPGVESATAITHAPMIGMAWMIEAVPEGADPEAEDLPQVLLERSADNYHGVMDIPLLRGRPLAPGALGSAEMVVSETAAGALWPDGEDPLGKVVTLRSPEMDFVVVGVARDTLRFGLSRRTWATVWVHYRDAPHDSMTFIARAAGPPAALRTDVTELIRRLDPELPILNLQTMDEVLYEVMALPRFYLTLMGIFGGIAISLASIGFYGVMSYTVGRRNRELGVRVALGASPAALRRMVLRQGVSLVAVGIGIGLAACLTLTRVIESLLFGFSATEPVVYGALALVILVVGVLACYLPARRATRVDPLTALRSQ